MTDPLVRPESHGPIVVQSRTEHGYFLDSVVAQRFVDSVSSHLEVHSFHPTDDPDGPRPAHYVTTLYFDSASQEIARRCETGGSGARLRVRENYYRDDQGIRREPILWLEVKTRSGSQTRKVRFPIPAHEVSRFLTGGSITQRTVTLARKLDHLAQPVLDEIAELCTHAAGPLQPDCLAHYRRQAWQDSLETVRITLDTELTIHRPLPGLLQTGMTLAGAIVGPPVARLSQSLVEIKVRGDQPSWLRELIAELGLDPAREGQEAFSKFIAASHAVHPRADRVPKAE